MFRSLSFLAIAIALACLPLSHSYGQQGGNRAVMGIGGMEAVQAANPPLLERKIAEGYITIEGLAELRVQPTEIRIVMAATAEGETAQKCREAIDVTIASLKAAWSKMDAKPENVVVDFIAVLPRYTWSVEKRDNVDVGVEKKVGYRMQTNIHLAVRNESQAQTVLNRAFEQGVTDIIAFDYWSKDLDGLKVKARHQAPRSGTQQIRRLTSRAVRRTSANYQRAGEDDCSLPRIALSNDLRKRGGYGAGGMAKQHPVHPRLPPAANILSRPLHRRRHPTPRIAHAAGNICDFHGPPVFQIPRQGP